ncbi:Acid protease [Mycena indigotica]|uniref:Acid protease n=1 Tax=Mycena indigotica TaxID=2126181 RepID=A0A8H6TE01_9AGAR|nr:Acid protease [Mycena indigotica]KAF7315938.1 Acid protease [Mycena indigotica]
MGFLSAVFALSLLTSGVPAHELVVRHSAASPRALDGRAATVIPPADFSVAITGKTPRRRAKKVALERLRGKPTFKSTRPGRGGSSTVPVDGSDFDDEYLTNVTVGGQHFSLIIDTGSSDTWVAQKNFNCFDLTGAPLPEDQCFFGTAGFDPKASKTFKPFPNVSFNITYGDGEFLSGPVGFDTISIGGLSVKNQELGFPTLAAWEGDGVNTGLIGLAFPDLTSVYNTTDPTKASSANQIPYDPLFVSAVKQKRVKAPFFSVALNRGTFDQQENDPFDPNLGFLSFGGLAPVPVTSTSVTVPVEGYSVTTGIPSSAPGSPFFFYTVAVQGFTFPGSNHVHTANNNTILDTGTTLNFIPTDVMAAFAKAFQPPATLDEDFGLYLVDCNAKVPEFLVTIGGVRFSVDGRDQILPGGTDENGNIICVLGTQDGGPNVPENIFILGDTFLHNVVSTFSPTLGELQFKFTWIKLAAAGAEVDGEEVLLQQEPALRPLTSLKWPYVPDQSSYPDPLKRDDPKPLQTHQYEAIGAICPKYVKDWAEYLAATSSAIRQVLAAHPSLPGLLTQLDRLRGHEREDALQRALGVSAPDIRAQRGPEKLGDDVLALRALAEAVEGAVRGGKDGELGLDWE